MLTPQLQEAIADLTAHAIDRYHEEVNNAPDALITVLTEIDPDWSEINEVAQLNLCDWLATQIGPDHAASMAHNLPEPVAAKMIASFKHRGLL